MEERKSQRSRVRMSSHSETTSGCCYLCYHGHDTERHRGANEYSSDTWMLKSSGMLFLKAHETTKSRFRRSVCWTPPLRGRAALRSITLLGRGGYRTAEEISGRKKCSRKMIRIPARFFVFGLSTARRKRLLISRLALLQAGEDVVGC